MSDHVPVFRRGDRVRIMQTTDMVRCGLANLRGAYRSNGNVRLDSGLVLFCGDASLMRVTLEQERRWDTAKEKPDA